jgi:Ca2+-binding RTX toxin-like protein
LTGTEGNDVLQGGAGNDTINGGNGFDIADFTGISGDIVADLGGVVTIDAVNADTLTGIEGLVGGSGDDTLIGNGIANYLDGGAGENTLTGGGGDDVFAISFDDATDIITDYGDGNDVIDLSKLLLASPENIDDYVDYNAGTGALAVDVTGSGNFAGDPAATVNASGGGFPASITIVFTDGDNRFELTV